MSKIPKKVGLAESFEGSFAIERLKRLGSASFSNAKGT